MVSKGWFLMTLMICVVTPRSPSPGTTAWSTSFSKQSPPGTIEIIRNHHFELSISFNHVEITADSEVMNTQPEKPPHGVQLLEVTPMGKQKGFSGFRPQFDHLLHFAAELPKCKQRLCNWEHDSAAACFSKSTDKLEALQNDAAEKRPCNTSFNKS